MELFQITKSKLRTALLNLYFINPERSFYLRELERILGFTVGNIRRELLKLEKSGLFKSERKGNQVYYSLNYSYPLFHEIKSIISKTSGISVILKGAVSKIKGIKCAFIYGSFAKSEERNASDVDLFILGNVSESDIIKSLKPVEKKIQREINYTLYSYKEYADKKLGKDPFVEDVVKCPKIFLIGDENEL
ncbi:nucleotidyltransferase domain-containing protein [bacterium]|nr:nucleotidyltransferase domain-containing protein [bacterium]